MTIKYRRQNAETSQIIFPDTVEGESNVESFEAYEDSLKDNSAGVELSTTVDNEFTLAEYDYDLSTWGAYSDTITTALIDNGIFRETESSTVTPDQVLIDSEDDNIAYAVHRIGTNIIAEQINISERTTSTQVSFTFANQATGNVMVQDASDIYIIYNTATEAKISKIKKSDFSTISTLTIVDSNTSDKINSIRIVDDIIYVAGRRVASSVTNGAIHSLDNTFALASSFYDGVADTEYFDITIVTEINNVDYGYYAVSIAIEQGSDILIGSIQIDSTDPASFPAPSTILKNITDNFSAAPTRGESNGDDYSYWLEGNTLHKTEQRPAAFRDVSETACTWNMYDEYNIGISDFEINFKFSLNGDSFPPFTSTPIFKFGDDQSFTTEYLVLYADVINKVSLCICGEKVFATDDSFTFTGNNYYDIQLKRNPDWSLTINGVELDINLENPAPFTGVFVKTFTTFPDADSILYDFNLKDLKTNSYVFQAQFRNFDNPIDLEISHGGGFSVNGALSGVLANQYIDNASLTGAFYDLNVANILGTNIIYLCGADASNKLLMQTYSELLVKGEDISIGYDDVAGNLTSHSIFVDTDNWLVYHYGRRSTTEHFVFKTDLTGDLSTNAIDYSIKFAPDNTGQDNTGAFTDFIEEDSVEKISLVGIAISDLVDDVIDSAVIIHGAGFKDYYQKGDSPTPVNTYYYVGAGGKYAYNKELGQIVNVGAGNGVYAVAYRSFYKQESISTYEAYLETADIYLDPSFRNNEMAKDNVLKAFITTAMSMANMRVSWSYDGNYEFNSKEKYVPMRRKEDDYKETGDFDNTTVRLDGSRQLCIKEVKPNSRNGHSFKLRIEAVMENNAESEVEALDEFKIININFTPAGAIYVEGD